MMDGFFCAGPAVSCHHVLFLAVLIGRCIADSCHYFYKIVAAAFFL